MKKRSIYLRPLAVAAVLATAAVGTGTASAASGATSGSGVQVTNTESVQVYVDADGKVGMQHVYEQLTLAGHGKADVVNPITTTGLRNLNGFSGVTVKDGKQVVDTTVDGEKQLRTVSNFHGKLPVKLSISYKLDGKPVKAADIVGKSGHLEVSYTVENVSAVPTQLTFDDGKGGTVTKTVDVPIPMVGSLSTTAPDNFRNVSSKQASMGGDGHGGTQMQFTLTLLPPIGPTKSTFGYSADITDGVVPRAELNALPVDPLSSPSFSGAASSYKGGADTGVQLTGGALQMDSGLVKLQGGASDLVAGLIKLHDGAGQLSDGLKDTAVPGAKKLADGTTQLDDGGKQLKDGAEIPLSRTTRNPEVEEILGALSLMLSGGGVQQLKTITTELNKMMDGRQKDVRDVLGRIDALVGSLDTQKTDIVNAMSAINDLTATLNKERKGIGAALDSFGPALKVLNQQHSALMTMLRSLDKLGKVGGRVIRESKDNVITTLKHLAPILRRLANAGNSLPKGLMMMASYPFPKEAATLAKGDYSNALFYMNFDLNKILKGVVKGGNTGLPDVKDLCGIYAGDPATCAPIFTTLCNLLPNNIVCGNGPGTEPTADAAEKAELKKESAKGSGDLSDTVTNLLDGVLGGSTSGQGSGSAGSSGSSGGLSGLLGLLGGGR